MFSRPVGQAYYLDPPESRVRYDPRASWSQGREGRGSDAAGRYVMLLVIGIEGANPDLVERLTSTGQMPTLRALMRHGVYGRLEPPQNAGPICAWSNLLTGVNPGKHGVWDLLTLAPESYEWQPAHSRMLRAPTLLQLLSERGREVGTVFVPMTYPAREAEWTTISGWLAPGIDVEGFAHPRKIASMAARRLQGVPLAVQLGGPASSGRYEAGLEIAINAMRAKTALIEELLADRRWDMLAVNFTELDRVLRWYWHLIDRNHPSYREDQLAEHGDPITAIHAEIDAIVARLTKALSPSDQLLVLAPYGIGLNTRAALCVPELMSHLDLLVTRSAANGLWHGLTSRMGKLTVDLLAFVRTLLPEGIARHLPAPHVHEAPRVGEADPRLDYERTWVIGAPGGHLFLHTTAEFPNGIVEPPMMDQLVLRISSALQTAIDPATGRGPLEWVRTRDRVCSGPYLGRIPHMITRWHTDRVVEGMTVTGRDGRVKIARPSSGRVPSGAPCLGGLLVAAGSGLQRGTRIEGARIEDVSATIMHLCGERVPSYFDGEVLAQALTPAFRADRPVKIVERDLPRIIEDPSRSAAAARAVSEHLRGLGYEY